MARALVLNATFEPLCVVSCKRALVLVLADKAEALASTGRLVRSETLTLDEPAVVRLSRFVRVPYQRMRALNRRAVFLRDGQSCQYCGNPADSIDHVIPRSRGGQHVWDNVVAACRRCNSQKRDRMLHETTMRLRRAPAAPHSATWFLLHDRTMPIAWEPYLASALERSA
jgi:5-methylcytosine-specific restriction endonuclease McrA